MFFSALLLILTLTVSYIVKKPDIVALSSIPEKTIIMREYLFSGTVNDVTVQIISVFLRLTVLPWWGQSRP